ncbi:hypothetical protein N7495_006698 [Penicillium taxi]|uniref:uncharacterized protein n=1 Tax=Penicillium taxi TaxID=168475 RepID=UPI002545B765|nr:uncharacterized protein N7495_006698 [Penicillium taxi]KAJ5895007.1 hypothetical protein N7495_006698 [Penicillium taxi]
MAEEKKAQGLILSLFIECLGSPKRGALIKQMSWALFSGQPQRTALIPLYGDPEAAHGGVSSRIIDRSYRDILSTLLRDDTDTVL